MTATKTAKATQRIERLRALAGDGNPNEHEREVARRALTRMLERMTESQRVEWTPNWQGEKYQATRGMGMTEITKLIRDEVRLLRKLGGAYNYDNSDIYTDYFDCRYYLSVDAAEPGSQWASHGVGYRY